MTLIATLFEAQPNRPDGPANPWLVDHLKATGALTESGLSRRARPRRCPTCSAWTVSGLDADILAFETHADPVPLSALGEVLALAAGRRTVELGLSRGRLELEQRWADHIASRPAGTGRYDVLAEHRHGLPVPATWSTASAFTATTATPAQESTCPPF